LLVITLIKTLGSICGLFRSQPPVFEGLRSSFFFHVCWLLFAFVSFPIVCWPLPFYIGFWFFICYFLFVSKHTICPFSLKHTSVEVALNSPPLWEAIDRYWRCINDSLSSTSHLILMVFLNTTELSLIDPKFLDK
jgi:hypothetical protein